MRKLFLLLAGGIIALPALADSPAPPAKVPPPPAISGPDSPGDGTPEPQVTIIKKSEETVEEFRINGRLYMIKVTPKIGPAYYLVDDEGNGTMKRTDNMGPNIKVPQWVLMRF